MPTYSFANVQATITGPGGSFAIGASAGPGEEGITVTKVEKNTQQVGADGTVANSMHANENGKITVKLLKTSGVNAQLSALYAFQSGNASNWGQNVITINDTNSGDLWLGSGAAFTKFPDDTYGTEANVLEWEFDVANLIPNLGVYS